MHGKRDCIFNARHDNTLQHIAEGYARNFSMSLNDLIFLCEGERLSMNSNLGKLWDEVEDAEHLVIDVAVPQYGGALVQVQ